MPTLTRWFLRAAMVHLLAALALGVVTAVPGWSAHAGAWRPVYVHLLVMGWAGQMIFGVAYWMFPRREPLDATAVDWLGWTCFATLNAGLIIRAAAEPAAATRDSALTAVAVLASAVLQLVAVAAFVILAWPRVTAR